MKNYYDKYKKYEAKYNKLLGGVLNTTELPNDADILLENINSIDDIENITSVRRRDYIYNVLNIRETVYDHRILIDKVNKIITFNIKDDFVFFVNIFTDKHSDFKNYTHYYSRIIYKLYYIYCIITICPDYIICIQEGSILFYKLLEIIFDRKNISCQVYYVNVNSLPGTFVKEYDNIFEKLMTQTKHLLRTSQFLKTKMPLFEEKQKLLLDYLNTDIAYDFVQRVLITVIPDDFLNPRFKSELESKFSIPSRSIPSDSSLKPTLPLPSMPLSEQSSDSIYNITDGPTIINPAHINSRVNIFVNRIYISIYKKVDESGNITYYIIFNCHLRTRTAAERELFYEYIKNNIKNNMDKSYNIRLYIIGDLNIQKEIYENPLKKIIKDITDEYTEKKLNYGILSDSSDSIIVFDINSS